MPNDNMEENDNYEQNTGGYDGKQVKQIREIIAVEIVCQAVVWKSLNLNLLSPYNCLARSCYAQWYGKLKIGKISKTLSRQ